MSGSDYSPTWGPSSLPVVFSLGSSLLGRTYKASSEPVPHPIFSFHSHAQHRSPSLSPFPAKAVPAPGPAFPSAVLLRDRSSGALCEPGDCSEPPVSAGTLILTRCAYPSVSHWAEDSVRAGAGVFVVSEKFSLNQCCKLDHDLNTWDELVL